jgi:glycosyltransferase involved in cell wall biosynthesis
MTQTIDILMAVYNNAEYILAQLHSLMAQSYPHFRLIIRDDCSSDHSVSLIEQFSQQYPGKIYLIKGTKNLGARGNFAALMNEATADYVMFCDADDVWLPTKIEESLILIHKNEAIYGKAIPLLVHSDLAVVDKHLNTLNPSFWDYSKINPRLANSLNRLLPHNVITGCTMLINKSLLQLAAPIPQEAIMHDWWIGLIASAFGHIDFLAKPTILYRQHGKNDTGAKNWKSLASYLACAKKAAQPLGRQEMRQRLFKTIDQAAKFLEQYELHLLPKKKQIVQNYAALGTGNALQKRYLFFKHRYFKSTFIKNLGMFFLL